MYYDDITKIAAAAELKSSMLERGKLRYLLSSVLAGMYVGFGILLIFTIGGLLAQDNSPAVRIVMGAAFGIALSLVIMAGSELFTGNNMIMTIGLLEKRTSLKQVTAVHLYSFIGNLAGSVLIAWIFYLTGLSQGSTAIFMQKIALTKMSLSATELFARGILCNMLVCLALWCSFRMKEEAGKLIMIFWCLFAFITSGYEHSVANMTLLSGALMIPSSVPLSISGFWYNIGVVTLGNFVGGALFIACSYWYISKGKI
ncbi:formate/nitrite transporter family protein [Dendrosporobacter sp. 1207_IL3150]|uniref:formate/nitrite transporter family protein n=1 Tax=Dendrosporobacter sp. 1207_IL3150 TaxID=3084054 RepID=UPI002FD96DF2